MIESQANPHIKYIRSLAADRKDRRRERLFVLEGVRLVADALDQIGAPELVPRAYPATAQVVAAASDTVHPQGVVALARWPAIEPGVPGIILVLDTIQDP